MKNYHHKLFPNQYYHIYNRANGNDRLFSSEENYSFFLKKYCDYIDPIVETICYCLMPNHFHFVIRVRDEDELSFYKNIAIKKTNSLENILSQQFSNFFNSYTQAYNKQQDRKGSLFMKNFNRLEVKDETYLIKLILYVHNNPVEAGLANNIAEWRYSSYFNLSRYANDLICSSFAIEYFDDLENFIYCHKRNSVL